jgi:pyruvate dehydrogenase E1 component alpha subunit/2-oxoisovalerate dehydrogenase E1 component alpha subunit
VAWSSVIGTQLPHAMGAAWAARHLEHDVVCMGYMGDGASSSGDFHAAANFAGVFKLPLVFFCQNNQWAISVPLARQTASESIAIKAQAYGFPGVRVDGNDIIAVIEATREAVERARRGDGPTLVEAVTFRMAGHSSSDDPTRYRDAALVAEWERRDPLARFRAWLRSAGLLAEGEEERWKEELNAEIGTAIQEAETLPPPPIETMFTDVYKEMPPHLAEQMRHARAIGEGTKFEGAFPL